MVRRLRGPEAAAPAGIGPGASPAEVPATRPTAELAAQTAPRRSEVIVVLNLFDILPGREKQYALYLRRVQPLLDRVNARILLYGLTRLVHMGHCPQEYCGLVAYDSLDDLRRLSHDPEFNEIRPLRDSSTTNYVLTTIESFPSMTDAVRYLENGGQD